MRAYEFVLPTAKVGKPFTAAIAGRFGGCTSWQAEGAWLGPQGLYTPRSLETEEVTIYRVAVEEGWEAPLLAFVLDYAKQAGEKALYFGPPDSPTIYQTGN